MVLYNFPLVKFFTPGGVPFHVNSSTDILKMCIGNPEVASAVVRYPVVPNDCVTYVEIVNYYTDADYTDAESNVVINFLGKCSRLSVGLKTHVFSLQWLILQLDMSMCMTLCNVKQEIIGYMDGYINSIARCQFWYF